MTDAGFELAPAGAGALPGLDVHDGEYTDAGIRAGATVVGTRPLTDIQIPEADLHEEGHVRHHLWSSRSGRSNRYHSSGSIISRPAVTEDTAVGSGIIIMTSKNGGILQ